MKKKRILFVDDDREMRQLIVDFFHSEGYKVTEAANGKDALEQLSDEEFDVVITDLRMQEMDGLSLLRQIRIGSPNLPVILITAFGSIETAVEAIKEGATNFIPKPLKMQTLKAIVDKAVEQKWLVEENEMLKEELQEKYSFHNILGKSKAMQQLYDLIKQVAASHSNLLIEGESGTGKELVARALAFQQSAFVSSVCCHQLFGSPRNSFGKRIIRLCERSVYGRERYQEGSL